MKKQVLLLIALTLMSFTAAYAGKYYVTIEPEGAGSVNQSGKTVFADKQFTITATANAGYSFAGWYVGGELVGTDNPHTFTMIASGDMYITAKFKEEAANTVLGFVKAGCEGMGTVSVSPTGTAVEGGYKFTHGTNVTLKALSAKGYRFVRWEDANGATLSTSTSYSFTLNEDCAVYAVFSALENYKADLVSFPGAEGWGRFTTGGRMVDSRGAKVYYVTRLDDTGEVGTFRWAVTTGDDTPRTVLFKVAGTIYLTSKLSAKANTTIVGQTAPGGGICLAGYQMKLGSNSIVRHIRFRAGDLPSNSKANNGNSMSMLDVENVTNIMMDHCTFAWSMEENLTMYDCDYTTVQWCIFSESLYNSGNLKGARAYGAQWGGEHGTLHHCLFAHNVSRSPRFNGVRSSVNDRQVDSEFINNVIYNWGNHNSVYGGECSAGGATDYNRTYMINNYYRPGPATKAGTSNGRHFVRPTGGSINEVGEWYLSGNKFETGSKWAGSEAFWKDDILEKVNADNYWGFLSEKGRAIHFWSLSPTQELYDTKLLKVLPEGYQLTMSYETADEAFQKVVKQAGASLPRYDEVDARVLKEAAGETDPIYKGDYGQLGIIDTPYDITLTAHDEFAALREEDNTEIDVTCYPRLQPVADDYANQVVDTDGDGLPDSYETEVGLNPNDATDGMKLTASGYSNLEVFLNAVADRQIDATQYTQHQAVSTFTAFNAVVGDDETYQTLQAAIDAAPADDTPYYIFVKSGTYTGHVQIDRANVHITGQSKQNTIVSWDKTAAEGGVDNTATVNVTAANVSFDNLTIRNTRTNEGQALALYTKADRIALTSCNLEGWQDTYRTGKDGQRHLVRNSKVSGTTDFVYGAGEVFFDADTLVVVRSTNVIVAPDHASAQYGYVFSDCVIDAKQSGSTTALGRPWGNKPKTSFLNTRLTSSVSITAEGWNDMGGLPQQMAEYNTRDANGNAVDLSSRKTVFKNESGTTATSKAVLTPVEVNSYKLDYMLRGSDSWDADWQAFILPAPAVYVTDATISWADLTGFSKSYLVVVDGKAEVTTATSRANDGKKLTVQAISQYGVLGEVASSDHPTGIRLSKTDAEVVHRQYFTPDGRQVSRLQHGLNLIRETLVDGSTRTIKLMAK
ncbi:MAG: InlB B-repeat-containing protein [Prevotella sp.]|nr:InlB B-repeat-containing protein [Prevotella sp.]